MKYTADVVGILNGSPLHTSGVGEIDVAQGIVRGRYDIVKMAPRVDTLLFNCVLVTGYPSVCKKLNGAYNPFEYSSYEYMREVAFEGGGHVTYRATCHWSGIDNVLQSVFRVEAELPEVSLLATCPLVETWVPMYGRIQGMFQITWKRQDGGFLAALARTIYRPSMTQCLLARAHQRRISLVNQRPSPDSLLVWQESEISPL